MLVDRELKEVNITIDNLEKHVQELQQKLGKYEEEGEQRKRRSSFFKRDVKKQYSTEVDKYRDLKTAQELASVSLFVTLIMSQFISQNTVTVNVKQILSPSCKYNTAFHRYLEKL